MPYRNAYWWMLLLFPAVGLAFWPSYFGRLPDVSWVLHAHGITASLWIALAALQGWSISRERRPIHRFAGRTSMALFPLFWVSGLLIVQFMAAGFLLKDNPFHALYGARLAPVDIMASGAVLYLYYVALSRRRSVLTHAAAMLAIPLFLLPPIFVRIMQIGGPFAIHGPSEFYKFGNDFELCNAACVAIGLWLWSRRPRTAWPFLVASGTIALQALAFETLGRSVMWEGALVPLAAIPTAVIATIGFVLAAATVWLGWTRPSNLRAAAAAPAGAGGEEPQLGAG